MNPAKINKKIIVDSKIQ